MELKVTTLEGKDAGSVQLNDAIFGLEPRKDIIQRCINWQLAKRQAGTHKTKGRAEIARTGKKMYKQKGTGGARHGSRKAPIFRKGGVYKGPTPRSHAHDLPKKVRALGLKHALSAKAAAGKLVILEAADLAEAKTAILAKAANNLGWRKVLIIDADVNENFAVAARNLAGVDILPSIGANVYDILRRDTLVITKAGVEALEARLA